MIEIKGYYSDFVNTLSLIAKNEDKKSTLSTLETNIIQEFLGLIKNPLFYYIPYHPEDYEYHTSPKKNIEIIRNLIIETEIESYELISRNTRMRVFTPALIIQIKETNKNFADLSLITNSKIRDNLTIVVRKHNGVWQIPTIGYSLIDDQIEIIELFKKRHFEFIHSQNQINIQDCLKILSVKNYDLHKKNISIINNKTVDFLVYPVKGINYKVPAFLFTKMKQLDANHKVRRLEEDNLFKEALDDMYYYGVRLQ